VKLKPSADHDIVMESLPDEITIKRINKALATLSAKVDQNKWIKLLFGDDLVKPGYRSVDEKVVESCTQSSSLNDSQKSAVKMVATARDLAVIHGRKCSFEIQNNSSTNFVTNSSRHW
jgi:hypothetical protein